MHLFPNGKKYIGITCQNVYKRWDNGYGYMYQNNLKIARAIKKYGWNNILHIVIKENITRDMANALEKAYIQHYKTTYDDYGYNITAGGNGVNGYSHSDATKAKMRAKALGRKFTDEHIDNLRKSHLGYIMPNNQKEKISKGGRKAVAEGRGHITRVLCVETGEIFNTITEAANKFNIKNTTGISNVINGRAKTCYGYHWEKI